MPEEIKRIDIKEFREFGFLQELNRRFLHPMGLAMEVVINDDGSEDLGGVWDYRKDKEGMIYDIENSDDKRKMEFEKKAMRVIDFEKMKHCEREKELGFIIEPLDI